MIASLREEWDPDATLNSPQNPADAQPVQEMRLIPVLNCFVSQTVEPGMAAAAVAPFYDASDKAVQIGRGQADKQVRYRHDGLEVAVPSFELVGGVVVVVIDRMKFEQEMDLNMASIAEEAAREKLVGPDTGGSSVVAVR
jgi:hypothetical protein